MWVPLELGIGVPPELGVVVPLELGIGVPKFGLFCGTFSSPFGPRTEISARNSVETIRNDSAHLFRFKKSKFKSFQKRVF